MAFAEFSPLQGASRVVLADNGNRILLIAFVGEHHYSHGPQMASQIKGEVAAERPAGILVDLLRYEYEFGNDVCGLFIAGHHEETRTLVPTCIVAIGKSRACMEALYTAGQFGLEPYLGFAASVADGLAWLSQRRDVEAARQEDSPDEVRARNRDRGSADDDRIGSLKLTSRPSLFPGFCALLLGAALLSVGALLFNYHPAVEFARATENETRREIAPPILMVAGSAFLGAGAFLLFRRREH